MHDEPLIDTAVWRELQDTAGAEFSIELAHTFLDEAIGMLAGLRSAQAAGDADAFRRAAHSLKSNALTFGAGPLAQQARALELGGLASASPAALEALATVWQTTAAALKATAEAP